MKQIWESPECQLLVNSSDHILHIIWKEKLFDADVFKQHLLEFAAQGKKQAVRGILVDARKKVYVVSPEVQSWHDDYIIPQYLAAGIKAVAFINPEKIFTELTTRKIFEKQKAKEKLTVSFFKDADSAIVWLTSVLTDTPALESVASK